MKSLKHNLLLLLFFHFPINCMDEKKSLNEQVALFILPEELLQNFILSKFVIPKSLRFADFQSAKENFRNINLSCKKLKQSCELIPINVFNKETQQTEKISVEQYLKKLHEKANQKNRLRNHLLSKENLILVKSHLGELSKYTYLAEHVADTYPKLSLYLCQYPGFSISREITLNECAVATHDEEFQKNIAMRLLMIRDFLDQESMEKEDSYTFVTPEGLKKMLENLHDPDKRDANNRTPLYYAIKHPSCPVVMTKLLIDFGASLQNIDGEGNDALQIARAIQVSDYLNDLIDCDDLAEIKHEKIALLEQYQLDEEKIGKEKKSNSSSCSIQ